MPAPGVEFFHRVSPSARVLVLDLGFLGDTIQLIPALAAIRRALPQAHLEVMVSEHIMGLLAVCPWLDAVRGYPRFPKGPPWYKNFGRARALRAAHYDVVINLNGSDRSSILTRLTGAPLRLGRVPPKVSMFWPHCFTHTVAVPRGTQTIYLQHLDALAAAGFLATALAGPAFPIEIPTTTAQKVAARLGAERAFVHVSPFATQDEKELPVEVLAEFLNAAAVARPDLTWVLSTAPNERERAKLTTLRAKLKFEPWKIFPGDLDLVELTEVMRRARLHLGGDSGALHVALMAGTPTLSWWRDYTGRIEWTPQGPRHAALVGRAGPGGIEGINAPGAQATLADLLQKTAADSNHRGL
jgi:ADP-heptose:LPS heptosyltransferase